MKKYDIHTTLSPSHYALLNKFTEKYETKQKTLEKALEALDTLGHYSSQNLPVSPEEKLWIRVGREIKETFFVFDKKGAKVLFETADIQSFREYVHDQKPVESAIEYYYRKPLNECSLQEIIDGVILNIKFQGSSDMVNCTDDGNYYTINIKHSMGLNFAMAMVIEHESLFKSYRVKTENHFSERSVFFKIYKKEKSD
jgi:hypothetical protein